MWLQGTAVDDPEKAISRKPDDNEPLAGLAFKIMADQFQVRKFAPSSIPGQMCISQLPFLTLS